MHQGQDGRAYFVDRYAPTFDNSRVYLWDNGGW